MATTLHAHPALRLGRGASRGRPHRPPRRDHRPRNRWPTVTQALALPFDAARSLYAHAVLAGVIERSLLANAEFERTLGTIERIALGPWARRV